MNELALRLFKPILLLGIVVISFSSCTMVNNKDMKALSYGTCEGCHTDYEHLKLVYTPDSVPPPSGCGGTAPSYMPYDRVWLGGPGYEEYKGTVHDLACTKCHNGVDFTSDKTKAHSGDFIRHPSEQYEDKCAQCHSTLTDNFGTNLHNGIGQKDKVTKRSGLTGHAQFDQLPQHKIDGYNANCATCHGTCGNCHIVRPKIKGGGLARGHQFIEEPDMIEVCVGCHTSRGGHAYMGWGVEQDPTIVKDVHLIGDAGFNKCTYCHTETEIHGTGEAVDHRYDYSALPSCTAAECHQNDSEGGPISESNIYHEFHINDFNCHVCHSQDYNSCGSCHVGGDGARMGHYLDFKIALNPLQNPDERHNTELALVRRTLAAPDNWDVYTPGDDYDNFDAFPMFNYTTPHNIKLWTNRTNESGEGTCSKNCHIRFENGQFVNKELYLLDENLTETWMQSSTGHITLDDRPVISGWLSK
ncbi:MAG: hypothetical protein V2I37_09880 [Marinilabiliaceae bacterium]|jgi:thiosulfate/3-mercaptopyruvate sulfurtransferase|nr:hypothetical protein [Marinilabiliaceae bacterium]